MTDSIPIWCYAVARMILPPVEDKKTGEKTWDETVVYHIAIAIWAARINNG